MWILDSEKNDGGYCCFVCHDASLRNDADYSWSSHKYVAKKPVGVDNGGHTVYRYFYSLDEWNAYNKNEKIGKTANGSRSMDLIGVYDRGEDLRIAGVSDDKNPYLDNGKVTYITEVKQKPVEQLAQDIENGKEYVEQMISSSLNTVASSIDNKKKH